MAEGIFLLQGNDLVELFEARYDSENTLQRLLADYPNLMPGQQINPVTPRRWLLVCREAGLADELDGSSRWSVDHLFIDQEGIPTLVEVKRSTDTRIRREIVGQMLDYGANAVLYWPVERIRALFETRCNEDGVAPEEVLAAHLGGESDIEKFWQAVSTNMQAGRIRIIFVSDFISSELRRIVEFLNGQMQPAEVLAVEVRQFAGQGLQTFVPRVMGVTAQAQYKKQPGSRSESFNWDEASFCAELSRRGSEADVEVAQSLLQWAKRCSVRIWWGKGRDYGSFFLQPDVAGEKRWLLSVWTDATFAIVFEHMKTKPPFDQKELRLELRRRVREVLGPSILVREIDADRRLQFKLSYLYSQDVRTKFEGILDWSVAQIRR